jgi:hypothetical protein
LAANFSVIERTEQYDMTFYASSNGPFTLYMYEGTTTPILGDPDNRTSNTYWGAAMNRGEWVNNTWVNGEKLDFTHENNGKKIKDISGISNKGNNTKNLKLAKERANKLIQTVLTDVSKTPGIKLSTSFDWSSDIDM